MSLDDVQHVEAVAIMRRLADAARDPDAVNAAQVWLKENHPEPAVYMAAMSAMAEEKP